jgi:DNA-binding winged helix-turn-helix (wHTH) protein/WD40 repeat protein
VDRYRLAVGCTLTYTHLKVTAKTEHNELLENPFRVGDWLVEPRLNRLTRGDESIQIEHKMMDVLVCLAERPGDLVPRQQIIDTVWAIEFISEGTLTRIVAELRRVLGDDARQPRFIETIRGKGYRLLAPVEVEQQTSATIAQFPVRASDDDRNPYPGLAAFTEADAEFFFGREADVTRLWRTITSRRLLVVIGPSGVGKTSFLRAGLIPAAPEGWGKLICQPGEAPFAALARALAPQFEGDAEAIAKLVDIRDETAAVALVSRWRDRHNQALLIVDQFEEIFTLNPPEGGAGFSALIGRLARDADVHVLLSMRDDFLYRCHEHTTLSPIFTGLIPVKVPASDDLRRALVQPAARYGFSFENGDLVDELLDAVADERGALPLLAFAVARLWDKRDRDRRLLTRQAYSDVGGVAGALAHHAEATLERIGTAHLPLVREIFRNLITAEETRAVRGWDELLSVFSDSQRESPEEVLRQLIAARLLTSYEVREEDSEAIRHVEIIHESLLANWPRLLRWQTQDADAAQLRDQLRQAARTWNEHNRSDDLLWTGSVYREFAVWRERYLGGLSEIEAAFAAAMTAHAKRRKRRRRTAAVMAFAVLLVVLGVIGVSRQQAIAESRRAEAANVFSLAQLQVGEYPTAAIAYAIASLELSDNPEVRRLVLETLWRGPTEIRLPTVSHFSLDFSPDGRWLATADPEDGGKLWPSDGGPPTILEGSDIAMEIRFSPKGDLIASTMDTARRKLGLWSVPEGRLLRSLALGDQGLTQFFRFSPDGQRLITITDPLPREPHEREVRSWPVVGGEPDLVAHLPMNPSSFYLFPDVDPTASRIAWPDGRHVRTAPLAGTSFDVASVSSVEHDRAIAFQVLDAQGLQMASSDQAGTIQVWSLQHDPPRLTHTFRGKGGISANALLFDPSGSKLAGGGFLWDLTAPESEPFRIRDSFGLAFAPTGDWLAAGNGPGLVSLWPLARAYRRVLRGHEASINGVAFTPDGTRLITASEDGSVREWPLAASAGDRSRVLHRAEGTFNHPNWFAMAPDGSFVVTSDALGQVTVLPLDGGPARALSAFTDVISSLAVGPGSRLVAAGSGRYIRENAMVRVWDLETGAVRILDAGDGERPYELRFAGDGGLWVASGTKLRRWRLDGDTPRVVVEMDLSVPDGTEVLFDDLSPNEQLVLLGADDGRLWTQDLGTGEIRELRSHAGRSGWASFDPSGEIVVSTDTRRQRRRDNPPLAHARSLQAASPHPAARGADRQAEDPHQPPGCPRRGVLHRMENRGRPLPWVGDGAKLVTFLLVANNSNWMVPIRPYWWLTAEMEGIY